jgi:type VI secretion system protein ImpA
MASENIINIDQLVEPIAEDKPVGEDLREDASPNSDYYTVKGERQAARSAERKNLFDRDTSEADAHWHKVLDLAPPILSDKAKDLEVACWYTEALIRRYGFQGLRDGLNLLRQLIENYWDDIYPLPDEDGLETRVAPLAGLNGEGADGVLIAPIRNVMVTEGNPPAPFNVWHYQQARDVQKINDEEARAEKAAKLGFSVDDIDRAVNESDETFFVNLRDDIRACIDEYRRIDALLAEKCGAHDAPPTSNVISVLEECLGVVNHIGRLKLPSEEAPAEETGEASEGGEQSAAPAAAAGPIQSRDQAFKQLRIIADFFRQTEPHSPISYVLEKAIKWGGMSLAELIPELIPDSSSREHYSTMTGVRPEDEN